jgi:hypothetical protein
MGIPQVSSIESLCDNLFSDVLHRPFLCAHTPLGPFVGSIPDRNRIVRISDLTASEFSRSWTDVPFVLTQPVKEWPVYQKWTFESFIKDFGNIVFRAESVDWPFHTYLDYMENNSDESPLYLFDRSFVEKMKLVVGKSGDYWIPDCFGEDLFAAMDEKRPDSRWLIVGPERSGSTFHKDPNATRYVITLTKDQHMLKYHSVPGTLSSRGQNTGSCSHPHQLVSLHQECLFLKTKVKLRALLVLQNGC